MPFDLSQIDIDQYEDLSEPEVEVKPTLETVEATQPEQAPMALSDIDISQYADLPAETPSEAAVGEIDINQYDDLGLPPVEPEKRTYEIAEAEVDAESGFNPFAALEVIDRPRAATASGLIATLEGKDKAEVAIEMAKGAAGEQHPMMGDYFSKKAQQVLENPEEYPVLSNIFGAVNSAFENAAVGYEVLMAPQRVALNKEVYGDALKVVMADTKEEKEQAEADLQAGMKEALTPLMETYASETAGLDALAHTAGFAVDVAIDPVTYTHPILSFTKKGLLAPIPQKYIDQYAKAAKINKDKAKMVLTTTKTGRSLKAAAEQAWNLFSTSNKFKDRPKVEELRINFMNMVAAGRIQAIREGREFQDRIKIFAAETGTSEKEVEKFITEAVERGGVQNVNLDSLSDEALEILAKDDNIRYEVWSLSQRNAAQLQKEIDAGITISPLAEQPLIRAGDKDASLLLAYFTRAVTPEAREAINLKREAKGFKPIATGGDGPTAMSGKHSSTIARNEEWEGLTINDINQLARDGDLPGYEGQVFPKGFFYDDPALAQAMRDSKHYRAMAARTLADEIIDPANKLSVPPDKLIAAAKKSGWVPPKGKPETPQAALNYLKRTRTGWERWKISSNPLTEGYVMDRDIVDLVDGNLNAIYDPKKTNAALKVIDETTSWWKAWTLSIFPAYHVRNQVGNLWNNAVMDVNPKFYKTAGDIQSAVMGAQLPPARWGKVGRTETVSEDVLPAYTKFKTADGREWTYTELRDLMDENGIIGKGFMATDVETTLRSEMGGSKYLTLSKENKAIEAGKRIGETLENNARIANFLDGLNKGMSVEEAASRVRLTLFDYSDLTEFEQKVMKRLMPFYTWTRKNIPFQISQMVKKPGRYKAVETLRLELESAVGEEDTNERYLASWMLENYPTKVKVDEETGKARYFIMGGWIPAADVWKLAAAPTRVFWDNLHPAAKVLWEVGSKDVETGEVTDLFTGKKLHPKLTQDYLGFEVAQTTAHYLNNLRVLATIDDFMKAVANERGTAPKKLSPFVGTPKTVEEAMLAFFTGIRTYETDLEHSRIFKMMDEGAELRQLQSLYQKSVKAGTPQPELLKEMIEKSQEAKSKFKLGGLLDQSRKLFNKGGSVDKEYQDTGYWSGATKVPAKTSPDEEDGVSVNPLKWVAGAGEVALSGVTGAAGSLAGYPAGAYVTATEGREAGEKTRSDVAKAVTIEPKLAEGKAIEEGLNELMQPVAEAVGPYANEILEAQAANLQNALGGSEVVNYLARHAPETLMNIFGFRKAGNVVQPEKLGEALSLNAPNYLPGFYNGGADQAGAVAKGAVATAGSLGMQVLSPKAMRSAKDMAIGYHPRKILKKQAKLINQYGAEIERINLKIKDGTATPEDKKLKAELRKKANKAGSVIVGQMTYNANIARQYGLKGDELKLWERSVAKDVGTFDRDGFEAVMDASDVSRQRFKKKDMDDFFGSIKRAWGYSSQKKPIHMVVRPISFGGGGDFRGDFNKSAIGNSIKQAALETNNVDDFKKRLVEIVKDKNIQREKDNKPPISAGIVADTKRTSGTKSTTMLSVSFNSSSYAEGSVNMTLKVNPKTKDFFFVVSDDHDLFGLTPPGASRLLAITPVSHGNFQFPKQLVQSEKEAVATREAAKAERAKSKDIKLSLADQMSQLEPKDTKGKGGIKDEYIKHTNLSKERADIVNAILRHEPKATPDQLINRGALGTALALNIFEPEEDDDQPHPGFNKGGVVDEEEIPSGNYSEVMGADFLTHYWNQDGERVEIQEQPMEVEEQPVAVEEQPVETEPMDAVPPEPPVVKQEQVEVVESVDAVTDYLDRTAFIESSNNPNAKAKSSRAVGLYQFVPKTWNDMLNRYRPDLAAEYKGKARQDLRLDPELSRSMARKLAEEHANAFKRRKIPVTQEGLYMAHFAGISTALKAMKAKPETKITDIFSANQIKSNQPFFKGKKTIGEVRSLIQMKLLKADKHKKRWGDSELMEQLAEQVKEFRTN